MNNFKYQEPEFYSRLFDEAEKGTFEVPSEHANKNENSVPDPPMLYVL